MSNLQDLITAIGGSVSVFAPILVATGLLLFIWGLVKFIWNAGNEEAKEEGKRIMIWGIIAIFVMVSVWGIVSFLQGSFGIQGIATIEQKAPTGVTLQLKVLPE